MSRRRIAVIVAFVVLTVGTYVLRDSVLGHSSTETAVATRGSIDVTVQTVGAVQPSSSITVNSRSAGTVEVIAVRSGDRVSAGDIMILLDQQSFQDQVDAATTELEDAEFALQFAERQLADNPNDDSARTSVLTAETQVSRAQAGLSDAKAAISDAAITASTSGIVSQVSVKEGAAVAANQPVVVMFDPDSLELVSDVDELDLPNVDTGASVQFRLDAYPAVVVDGRITSTEPVAHQQGGSTIFSAHVAFDAPADLDIRPGMNADVTIVTARRDNVLLIPDRALRTVGDRSFVTVRSDGHDEEREIHLGYRSDGQVEVVEGLEEGDRVILH